jgi:hypothetical protein
MDGNLHVPLATHGYYTASRRRWHMFVTNAIEGIAR